MKTEASKFFLLNEILPVSLQVVGGKKKKQRLPKKRNIPKVIYCQKKMWFQTFTILFLFFCILSISESLKCYACRHSLRNKDVLDGIDSNPECMSFEKFYNNSAYIRTCGIKEIQCMVSFYTYFFNLNGGINVLFLSLIHLKQKISSFLNIQTSCLLLNILRNNCSKKVIISLYFFPRRFTCFNFETKGGRRGFPRVRSAPFFVFFLFYTYFFLFDSLS